MQRYLSDILNGLQEAVFLLDSKRHVVATNPAAEEIFGKGFVGNDFVHIIRNPECLNAIRSVLDGAAKQEGQVSIDMPVSATFHMVVTAIDSRNEDGLAALVSLRDISDKREAEQMRSDFVANVSHELRSPLTAIAGFIETLRHSAKDDPEAREHFLSLMNTETQRMVRLIADLLSLSKVQAQHRVRPQGMVRIEPLLRRVLATLASAAETEGKQLQLFVEPDIPAIPGSDDELTQVFQNLVENAVKYGRPNTEVRIDVALQTKAPGIVGEALSIKVSDRSEGIPQAHIFRLTERFYRVDTHRSRNKGGTGLGLAIVKHIINRHRGRLLIQSEMGVGSSFTVFLPTSTQM